VFLLLVGVIIVLGTYYNVRDFNMLVEVVSRSNKESIQTSRIISGLVIFLFAVGGFFSFKYGIKMIRKEKISKSNTLDDTI